MRAGYKIILIGICTYFGVLFTPVIASNVYCDFISQEICTFRITSVALPPFNTISSSNSSDEECYFENDTGKVIPIKRPRIEVVFRKFSEHAVPGTNPEFRTRALVDSGADICFIPKTVLSKS